jgi:hypothetical protein
MGESEAGLACDPETRYTDKRMTQIKYFPTQYPELNQVLAELVAGVQSALGADLLAAVLQGSFAVGDADEFSDVDWTMVMRDELTEDQAAALQAVHARIYALPSAWAQHLEGSYFPAEVLRQHADCSRELWYLDNGSRSLVRSTHCNTKVVRWVVRRNGISLAGLPPESLVDPISPEELCAEIRDTMREWGGQILGDPEHYENRFYQGFIVLSYCRMLHSLAIQSVASKRAGAEWARAKLDARWQGLIERSWATRPVPEVSVGTPPDPQDFTATLEFVRYALQRIAPPES